MRRRYVFEERRLRATGVPGEGWRAVHPTCRLGVDDGETTWWSPSASNLMVPTADLQMLKDAFALNDFRLCRKAWLGRLVQAGHRLAFCMLTGAGEPDQWYIALDNFGDSSVLGWPCFRREVGVSREFYFEISNTTHDRPSLVSIFDLSGIMACSFVWRSWTWQQSRFPNRGLPVVVRPFATGPPQPILQVACENAWWSMTGSDIKEFAIREGIDMDGCASLVDILFQVCKGITMKSDDEVMVMLSRRPAANDLQREYSPALLDIEEAVQTFDLHDHQVVSAEQQKARTLEKSQESFVRDFEERRQRVAATQNPGAGKRGKKVATAPARKALPSTIPQSQAKKWVPEGTHIWRGLTRSEWCGHCEPYKRIQASWHLHGEEGAMRIIIRRLWEQNLEADGLGPEACPFDGIFEGSSSSGQVAS